MKVLKYPIGIDAYAGEFEHPKSHHYLMHFSNNVKASTTTKLVPWIVLIGLIYGLTVTGVNITFVFLKFILKPNTLDDLK